MNIYQLNDSTKTESAYVTVWFETVLLIFSLFVLNNFYYLLSATIAAKRAIDYGYLLQLPIDKTIPFIPLFIIPYLLTWIYPIFAIVYIMHKKIAVERQFIRRISVAVGLLIITNCLVYVIFPTYYPYRVNLDLLQNYGFLGQLVQYIYLHEPVCNSSPSSHIALPWLIYRAFDYYLPKDKYLNLFKVFFALTVISVVTIKIHFLLDILFGILAAELVFQVVLKKLDRAAVFSSFSSKTFCCGLLMIGTLLAAGYFIIA